MGQGNEGKNGPMGLVRGILFITLAVSTSFLGVVIFHPAIILLAFTRHKLYRYIADQMIGSWCIFCAGLVEYLLGIRPVLRGDAFKPGQRNLIIMNHATRLDWMFLWNALVRTSGVKNLKIVLKDELKHLPGPGWAMQIAGFVFLRRRWSHDKTLLTDVLNYFNNTEYTCQVQLFPEGTDLNDWGVNSSNSFADKNGLPRYKYVLHPRVTGLAHLVHYAHHSGGDWDNIYDVTIAYPDASPKTEAELVMGNIPEEVHFLIHRYEPSDVRGENEEDTSNWCRQLWKDKETRLKEYYAGRRVFDGELCTCPEKKTKTVLRNVTLAWLTFTVAAVLLLCYSWFIRLLAILQVLLSLMAPCISDGWHIIVIKTVNWFYSFSNNNCTYKET